MLHYTLFKYSDGQIEFYSIMSTSGYREKKNSNCTTIKCGTYPELLHYCAENNIDF